jgi:hypothetical protein
VKWKTVRPTPVDLRVSKSPALAGLPTEEPLRHSMRGKRISGHPVTVSSPRQLRTPSPILGHIAQVIRSRTAAPTTATPAADRRSLLSWTHGLFSAFSVPLTFPTSLIPTVRSSPWTNHQAAAICSVGSRIEQPGPHLPAGNQPRQVLAWITHPPSNLTRFLIADTPSLRIATVARDAPLQKWRVPRRPLAVADIVNIPHRDGQPNRPTLTTSSPIHPRQPQEPTYQRHPHPQPR